MNFDLQPFLKNDLVSLRPIHQKDFKALFKVASDFQIWDEHQNKDNHTQEAFTQFLNEALQSRAAFVIIENTSGQIIGSSRFRVIDKPESIIEIGWSFLSRDYWGDHYNKEFK